MRRSLPLVLALVLVAAFAVPGAGAAADRADGGPVDAARTGVAQLGSLDVSDPVIGIATFPGRTPTDADAQRLEGLGLEVQLTSNLPLAIVRGPVDAMLTAVEHGYAYDVYPNERLETFDRTSSAAIGADTVWEDLGYDGSGVGVAVIDTGVDATHPDLEERVTHNIKILGSEYVESYNDEFSIVVPVDEGPYNNSDTSGHGTHVAGIVAADGSGDAELVGVAPGADIIGYGAGDVLFLFTVIASFDHVLEHHEEWGIHATNNSWGSSWRPFDPLHPINLATRALYDEGIVTVFAAGNSTEEMKLNPWSMAPWVISVGSTTLSAERSGFSSGGLKYDNSLPVELPEDGHLRFTGDRIGVYNPDVSAPGTSINSAGTPTGAGVLSPTEPGGSTELSGTSMAAPHVAGLVALLFEANPDLTPEQVKQVLQVTATDMRDGSPFWHSGYGFVDAAAAVELVTSNRFRNAPEQTLRVLQRGADRDVLAAREHRVLVSDHFWFEALPVSLGGSDAYELTFEVDSATEAIRATTSFATDLGLVGINLFHDWSLTLRDAAGEVVSDEYEWSGSAGLTALQTDVPEDAEFGEWTLEVAGEAFAADGVVLHNRTVSVAIAQLEEQEAVVDEPDFTPRDTMEMFFVGDVPDGAEDAGNGTATASTGPSVAPSPEGCTFTEDGVAGGGMTPASPEDEECEAGFVGYAWNYGAGIPATFVSEPLEADTTFGGDATLVTYLAEAWQPVWSQAFATTLAYEISAVGPDDDRIAIAGGDVDETPAVGPEAERGEYTFEVPVTEVPAGYSIRIDMRFSGFYTSAMRMLYGGDEFADAGLTLTTDRMLGNRVDAGPGGDQTITDPSVGSAVADVALPATGAPAWIVLALGMLLLAARLRGATRAD